MVVAAAGARGARTSLNEVRALASAAAMMTCSETSTPNARVAGRRASAASSEPATKTPCGTPCAMARRTVEAESTVTQSAVVWSCSMLLTNTRSKPPVTSNSADDSASLAAAPAVSPRGAAPRPSLSG
jgi:hypothetical protein